MKKFECKPGELCEGASCCKDIHSSPSVSLGDYLRISEFTKTSLTDMWRKNGEVSLVPHPELPPATYIVTLGLVHDPCPYLSGESRCEVYPIRPLGCASFPIGTFQHSREEITGAYKGYRCLQGVEPSQEQVKFWQELDKILMAEAGLELEHLWTNGEGEYIDLSDITKYKEYGEIAIRRQIRRDPQNKTSKLERIKRSIQGLEEQKTERWNNGLKICGDLYRTLWKPIVTGMSEDGIVSRLENLSQSALDSYKETTERWKELIKTYK